MAPPKSFLRLKLEKLYNEGELGQKIFVEVDQFTKNPTDPTSALLAIASLIGGPSWISIRRDKFTGRLQVTRISNAGPRARQNALDKRRENWKPVKRRRRARTTTQVTGRVVDA